MHDDDHGGLGESSVDTETFQTRTFADGEQVDETMACVERHGLVRRRDQRCSPVDDAADGDQNVNVGEQQAEERKEVDESERQAEVEATAHVRQGPIEAAVESLPFSGEAGWHVEKWRQRPEQRCEAADHRNEKAMPVLEQPIDQARIVEEANVLHDGQQGHGVHDARSARETEKALERTDEVRANGMALDGLHEYVG